MMTELQENPFVMASADSTIDTANNVYASDVVMTTTTMSESAFSYQDDHVHVEVPSTTQALVGALKRGRGRPRKYNTPEEALAARKEKNANSVKKEKKTEKTNNVDGQKKKGRPKKSDDEAKVVAVRAALARNNNTVRIMQNGQEHRFGNGDSPLTPVSMFHHIGLRGDIGENYRLGVIDVTDGEDIFQKLTFPQGAGSILNVIHATGFVKAVIPYLGVPSVHNIACQGYCEIMSLSGAYVWTENGERIGALSVILRTLTGNFLGGCISSYLIAAGPVQVHVSTCQPKPSRIDISATGTRFASASMPCDVYRPAIEAPQAYMFTRADTHQNNGTTTALCMVSQAAAHQHIATATTDGQYITSQAGAHLNVAAATTAGPYTDSLADDQQNVPAPGDTVMDSQEGQAEDGAAPPSLPTETATISCS